VPARPLTDATRLCRAASASLLSAKLAASSDAAAPAGATDAGERTYSIWFAAAPDSDNARVLSTLVADLAARHGGAPFPPHLTIVGAVPFSSPAAAAALGARLAALAGAPFTIPYARAAAGSLFFRCVYALAELAPPALLAVHAAARGAVGGAEIGGAFMPHVSLLYSHIDDAARAAVVDEVAGVVRELGGLRVGALEVWDTTSGEAHEGWTLVESFPLPHGGSGAAAAAPAASE